MERGALFNPLKPEKNQEVSKAHKPESRTTEVTQSQLVTRPTGETRRAYTVARPYSRRVPRVYLRKARVR